MAASGAARRAAGDRLADLARAGGPQRGQRGERGEQVTDAGLVWCRRLPSARSRAGLMLVSASRSRFVILVWSAARSVSKPLSTRSCASSSSDAVSSQWTCLRRVRAVSARK
jgi:hypothetical protein